MHLLKRKTLFTVLASISVHSFILRLTGENIDCETLLSFRRNETIFSSLLRCLHSHVNIQRETHELFTVNRLCKQSCTPLMYPIVLLLYIVSVSRNCVVYRHYVLLFLYIAQKSFVFNLLGKSWNVLSNNMRKYIHWFHLNQKWESTHVWNITFSEGHCKAIIKK